MPDSRAAELIEDDRIRLVVAVVSVLKLYIGQSVLRHANRARGAPSNIPNNAASMYIVS